MFEESIYQNQDVLAPAEPVWVFLGFWSGSGPDCVRMRAALISEKEIKTLFFILGSDLFIYLFALVALKWTRFCGFCSSLQLSLLGAAKRRRRGEWSGMGTDDLPAVRQNQNRALLSSRTPSKQSKRGFTPRNQGGSDGSQTNLSLRGHFQGPGGAPCPSCLSPRWDLCPIWTQLTPEHRGSFCGQGCREGG